MTGTNQSATQASREAGECVNELRAALSGASPLQALILLPLIERAATLRNDIATFVEASRTSGCGN